MCLEPLDIGLRTTSHFPMADLRFLVATTTPRIVFLEEKTQLSGTRTLLENYLTGITSSVHTTEATLSGSQTQVWVHYVAHR